MTSGSGLFWRSVLPPSWSLEVRLAAEVRIEYRQCCLPCAPISNYVVTVNGNAANTQVSTSVAITVK